MKINKKIIIIGIIILIIGIIFSGIIVKKNKLTENERLAIEIIKDYKSNLKNPNSLEIFEIRIYDDFVMFDNAGQNSFGGQTRNIVSYDKEEKRYSGNSSKANYKITKYTNYEDRIEILLAQTIQTIWSSENVIQYESVDVKRVMKYVNK